MVVGDTSTYAVSLQNIPLLLAYYSYVSKTISLDEMFHIESGVRVRVIVFNTTFNNISVISWRSVLLVEETS
jgi:hypothetical protein